MSQGMEHTDQELIDYYRQKFNKMGLEELKRRYDHQWKIMIEPARIAMLEIIQEKEQSP